MFVLSLLAIYCWALQMHASHGTPIEFSGYVEISGYVLVPISLAYVSHKDRVTISDPFASYPSYPAATSYHTQPTSTAPEHWIPSQSTVFAGVVVTSTPVASYPTSFVSADANPYKSALGTGYIFTGNSSAPTYNWNGTVSDQGPGNSSIVDGTPPSPPCWESVPSGIFWPYPTGATVTCGYAGPTGLNTSVAIVPSARTIPISTGVTGLGTRAASINIYCVVMVACMYLNM